MAKPKKRFEVKISLGADSSGNLIRKSFYSTKNRIDAKKKADIYKMQSELRSWGMASSYPPITFSSWARTCIETYKKPYIKANTYNGTYQIPLENHLIPYFSDRPISGILPVDIQQYINRATKSYAPETIKKDYTLLAFLFQAAVDNGLCSKSPVTKTIHLPKVEVQTEKRAYTQAQYDQVIEFAMTHPNGLAILVLLETGISRSELLGLQWKNVDLDKGILHVEQGLVEQPSGQNGGWALASNGLKNQYRRRDIPVVNLNLLNRLRTEPRELFIGGSGKAGKISKKVRPVYVFHSPQGGPFSPSNWTKRVYDPFMRDMTKAHPEIPFLTPHELRHTRATLWLAQGISPFMVAKLLGHGDLKMLSKVYDHTDAETLRVMLDKNAGSP